MARHWLDVTDEELVLLDGKVVDLNTQVIIDGAKARLQMIADHPRDPRHIAELAADIVKNAKTHLILSGGYSTTRKCERCGVDAGYHRYTKNGRRPKGSPNYQRPLALASFRCNSVTSCTACWEAAKPLILEALQDVPVEIQREISGVESPYKRFQNLRCKDCLHVGPTPAVAWAAPKRCAKCSSFDTQPTDSYCVINVHAEEAMASLARMAQ